MKKRCAEKGVISPKRLGLYTIAAALLMLVLVYICVDIYHSNFVLKITEYDIDTGKGYDGIRVVFISDVHSRQNSLSQDPVEAAAEQKPDIIALGGDMMTVTASEEDVERMLEFVRRLTEIAPVYYAAGNHEIKYFENTGDDILERVKSAGAHVIETEYYDISVRGQAVRIGGSYKHTFIQKMTYERWINSNTYRFLSDYTNTDGLKLYVCHRPSSITFKSSYDNWDIDVAMSGHCHGGLIRVPFVGSLYLPEYGWFPEHDCGCYKLNDETTLVVTSGFGWHETFLRFNNPPEICVLNIT